MNQTISPSRKSFGIFISLFFLISFSVYAATQLPWGGDEKVENGFLVTAGSSKEITVWSECRKITAATKNVYVPTRTKNEWDQFKAHPDNVGAKVEACACIPIVNSCNAPVPACETTTNGTDSCGTACSKTGPICSCIPNGSCSAPATACETTSYGTDNCGGSCSRYGGSCDVICPGGNATTLSPDQSPDHANSCSFTWSAGYWRSNTDYSSQSVNGTGNPPGSVGGSCNKYGSWDFTFICPNKTPGPVTCVGGGYTIVSSDGSNVCQFYWPTINVGAPRQIIGSTSGNPPGSADGGCSNVGGIGQWDYNYSCPNKVTPSCGGGGGSWGACSFMWGSASLGACGSVGGSPGGSIGACCVSTDGGLTAHWELTGPPSCPF